MAVSADDFDAADHKSVADEYARAVVIF